MDIRKSLNERRYELRASILYNEHVANHASSIGNDEFAERVNAKIERDREELNEINRLLGI